MPVRLLLLFLFFCTLPYGHLSTSAADVLKKSISINLQSPSSLAEAIEKNRDNEIDFVLPKGVYPVTADLTVPENISLSIQPGAILQIRDQVTLHIKGMMKAGLWQVFSPSGNGKVMFADNSVKEAYPQWWGAVGDGVKDSTGALQAAINSHQNTCLTAGVFNISETLLLGEGKSLYGSGPQSVIRQLKGNSSGIVISNHVRINNFRLIGNYKKGNGIQSNYIGKDLLHRNVSPITEWLGAFAIIENMVIENWGDDGIVAGPHQIIRNNKFINCFNEAVIALGNHCIISNNYVEKTASWGIDINASFCKVVNNTLVNCGKSSVHKWDMGGICLSTNVTADGVVNNLVQGNTIKNSDGIGILLFDNNGYDMKNNLITENTLSYVCQNVPATFAGAIVIQNDARPEMTVNMNSAVNNKIANVNNRGIDVICGKNLNIVGNSINRVKGEGIRVQGHKGIRSSEITISQNIINTFMKAGIAIKDVDNFNIFNNKIVAVNGLCDVLSRWIDRVLCYIYNNQNKKTGRHLEGITIEGKITNGKLRDNEILNCQNGIRYAGKAANIDIN